MAEQGGPKHEPGLREELVQAAMSGALEKLAPSDFFSDDAQKVIEEVDRKEMGRVERSGWYERFAYIQSDDSYFDLVTRREISRGTFNALFRHIKCTSIRTGRVVEASVSFDENRQAAGGRALEGVTYAAGEDILVARDGEVYANRWRDARPPVPAGVGNVQPWLDHVERLIPEQSEREHVLNVMAYKVQHPAVKINHAILHGGDQGCGKDTMWAPFLWAVCGPGLKNRGLMDNDTLGSQWGYQLEAEVIIINELREPEATARRALANKLKPIIAAPPEMLSINRKGMHPYDMVNRALVLAFSNDQVPISLDSQDRRWFAIWSRAPRMEPEAAAALWAWYRSSGFVAVTQWLRARDVSAFNPGATPAWTEWKFQLVEHGMTMAESFLVEMIRTRTGEFARGVVGSPFHAICDRLAGLAPSGVKVHQQALLHALKEAGWQDMGRLASQEYQTKKSVWVAPDLRGRNKSELRRMIEEREPGRLAAVK